MASVVIAEDNLDHQRVIAEIIRRLGHDVTVADDGRAGLAAVAEHRPDLVVADVDMPHLDGLQLCRAMREDPALAAIPVVLVTAYLGPSHPDLAAAGANAVVRKPFTVRELNKALGPYLGEAPAVVGAGERMFVDALLDTLDTGVAACDRAGRMVVVNDAVRDFYSEAGAAVPLRDWPERFQLQHHDGTLLRPDEVPLLRALAGERVERADLLACDRQGRPYYFVVNARPITDAGGATIGAVAAMHDITTEYRARRYEACKTEVLRVLARTPEPETAAGDILRAVGTTLGWPYVRLWLVDTVTDRLRPAAIFHPSGEQQPPPLPASFARGEGLAGLCWERGDLVWVPDVRAADSPVLPEVAANTTFRAAGAVPVRSGDTVTGVLTFFSDDHQEPEPALAVLLTALAANIGAYLEQRRADVLALHLAASTDEYIALVGHELRTPLTSIGTYTDLIAGSPDDTPLGEVRDLLDVVERNNTRLRTLVEQLLDLAALESGHAGLTTGAVDLAAVVGAAVDAARGIAAERRITVTAELPAELTMHGDRERLRQVVDNLLGNAIKYSHDDGTVTVTLEAAGDAAVLHVADAGIGIPAGEESQLFRRLHRASNARHSGIPGAGLGLSLSRVVVEQHGGTLTLAPRRPAGTAVTVRLPRTPPGAGA